MTASITYTPSYLHFKYLTDKGQEERVINMNEGEKKEASGQIDKLQRTWILPLTLN